MTEEEWQRRMVASEPRLSEIVEMYEQLGFEVRLEPIDPKDPGWDEEECTICLDDPVQAEQTRVVFTRPRPDPVPSEDNDLFD
jgi:signal recognition particle subunit SEC65